MLDRRRCLAAMARRLGSQSHHGYVGVLGGVGHSTELVTSTTVDGSLKSGINSPVFMVGSFSTIIYRVSSKRWLLGISAINSSTDLTTHRGQWRDYHYSFIGFDYPSSHNHGSVENHLY